MMSALQFCFRGAVCAGALVVGAAGAFGASDAPISPSEEFPVEAASLIAATTALFDTVEAGLAAQEQSNKTLRIRILGDATPTSASAGAMEFDAFPAERGPVNHLTGYRITWYPVDRLLGVVDFMGTYDGNRNLVCGFVTWDMTDPDVPKLEHLAANYVDLGLLATRHPGATHEALLNSNCAYGEIEPNFRVLIPQG